MWETGISKPRAPVTVLPNDVVAQILDLRVALKCRSLIVWGEHCTECAFPHCYSTCNFYTPRPDTMHCRRFQRGIEERLVKGRATLDTRLMKVRPRRWAKLEGQGPPRLHNTNQAQRLEQFDSAVSFLLSHLPVPYRWTKRLLSEWNGYKRALTGQAPITEADGFAVECMSDGGPPIGMTLTIIPQDKNCKQLYQFHFAVQPTYSYFFIPIHEIAKHIDLNSLFLIQVEAIDSFVNRDIIFGLLEFVAFHQASRERFTSVTKQPAHISKNLKAKCVVWDLDDTLWHGTLAEDGADGIKINDEVVRVIRSLDERGILNSIASKNNELEALAALDRFELKDLFLFPQIGWEPKSKAVRQIAQALNIGLDTLVFVDDQAFERAEVSESLSSVVVLPETAVATLLDDALFDVPVTSESAARRLMYLNEARRKQEFSETGHSNYIEFLRSCHITLEISRLGQDNVQRIYELSQRTNQLNISGARYEANHVTGLIRRSGVMNLVLRCQDHFGDYGVVGFLSANLETFEVEDFFMSCRVQRKRVEHAIFQYLIDRFRERGASTVRIRFRRTDRNADSIAMLESIGFELCEVRGSTGVLERILDPIPEAGIVQVVERENLLKEMPV
jgi:FkbH-like protein